MFYFRSRWVTVTLGGFGESSTIHWCSGPGNPGKSVVLPRGSASSGGYVTKEVLISTASSDNLSPGVRVDFNTRRSQHCAVFEIAQACRGGSSDVKDRPKFESIHNVTPAPLVAALASLAWPPIPGEHTQVMEGYCAFAFLRELGNVVEAVHQGKTGRILASFIDEDRFIRNGLIELFVLEGETPGQLSRDAQARGLPHDVFVPPGVAEGTDSSKKTLKLAWIAIVV